MLSKLSSGTSFPNLLIRFKTETLLTPKSLLVERKPEPSRYKRRACFFIDSGLAVDFIATAVFALMTLSAFGETRFYLFSTVAFGTIHSIFSCKCKKMYLISNAEYTNGLIRHYIIKGTDLNLYPNKYIRPVQNKQKTKKTLLSKPSKYFTL
ncbi:hypothetical protein Barb6XT_02129 [Bacteroidales bacterium Barb6XT]|nr:hypothetical protein Barb6XT_02129 [Bacteroidales bacterium Barb6XT]